MHRPSNADDGSPFVEKSFFNSVVLKDNTTNKTLVEEENEERQRIVEECCKENTESANSSVLAKQRAVDRRTHSSDGQYTNNPKISMKLLAVEGNSLQRGLKNTHKKKIRQRWQPSYLVGPSRSSSAAVGSTLTRLQEAQAVLEEKMRIRREQNTLMRLQQAQLGLEEKMRLRREKNLTRHCSSQMLASESCVDQDRHGKTSFKKTIQRRTIRSIRSVTKADNTGKVEAKIRKFAADMFKAEQEARTKKQAVQKTIQAATEAEAEAPPPPPPPPAAQAEDEAEAARGEARRLFNNCHKWRGEQSQEKVEIELGQCSREGKLPAKTSKKKKKKKKTTGWQMNFSTASHKALLTTASDARQTRLQTAQAGLEEQMRVRRAQNLAKKQVQQPETTRMRLQKAEAGLFEKMRIRREQNQAVKKAEKAEKKNETAIPASDTVLAPSVAALFRTEQDLLAITPEKRVHLDYLAGVLASTQEQTEKLSEAERQYVLNKVGLVRTGQYT